MSFFRRCLREENKMTKFQELGLKDDILKGINDLGYDEAFPIQEAAIPVLISGREML